MESYSPHHTAARARRRNRSLILSTSTTVFLLLLGAVWLTGPRPVQGDQQVPGAAGVSVHGTAADDLEGRFLREIWPLLTRSQANCVACHGKDNPSQLHFPADGVSAYHELLSEDRFNPHSPVSLLARVSATDLAQRMPPTGMPAWTDGEKARLRDFMDAVARGAATSGGPQADEPFPAALRRPYTGYRPPEGQDNTLLSYYQLRHKIATLFGDDWRRGDRDQYLENLAQLGGADFMTRFDEFSRPTPAYLSAVGELAADVSARAFLNHSGPFAGRPEPMPLPGAARDALVRAQIVQLYQRLLFRAPSAGEVRAAGALLQAVGSAREAGPQTAGPLTFRVVARDQYGQQSEAQASIEVLPAGSGLNTVFVNQDDPTAETRLGVWQFGPGDRAQRLVLSNSGTSGNVSFRSLTLRGPLPAKAETVIRADSPTISAEGAWTPFGPAARDGYGDENNDKGRSRLTVPIHVDQAGQYEVVLAWRKSDAGVNAAAVPVSVYARGQVHLTLPPAPPTPPAGQAQFFLDQTVDTVPFWDVRTAFLFDTAQPKNGVEIANRDTRKRVVADAVSYIPQSSPDNTPALVARAAEAVGHERWSIFKPTDFTPYNTVGPDLLSDDNAHKSELSLLFPAGAALAAGQYYHLRLTYPGHVDNDAHVPITVYARRSSPIVRLRAPEQAPLGSQVTLDASASYNVQHSPLHYRWSQIGGPQATVIGSQGPILHVRVVAPNRAQRAWTGLCQALILHPDFLFTRPRSLATTHDLPTRRRLQLVKLAQDLVGRPPTVGEVARLERGESLASLTDRYLASPEFETFYYRRVRLYLESHGTPTQDEPARLWRYLMQTGRPYTELLTADYTITPDGRRVQRPAYCGHSGVLTMPGFIEGKPGLPHFNYAAQVCEKFLGYVFEVTPAVVKARGTLTAASTVDPSSICYSCHQVLTPLAYQRTRWTDDGKYREKDEAGRAIDDSDRKAVPSYPFRGRGLEAFALAAQRKERFHRAIIQTHVLWFFGRPLRYDADERGLYRRLWDNVHRTRFSLKPLVRAIVTSPEYLGEPARPPADRVAFRPKQ